MKGILQEKFQIAPKTPDENGESWADFESVRKTYPTPGSEYYDATTRPGVPESASFSDPRFNQVPQGMSVDPTADTSMPLSLAGESDVSNKVNPGMIKKGYHRGNMRPTDDQYNGEHIDLFYGEATVDGETGFVERNNYLDRA